jgi:hypothetical protein
MQSSKRARKLAKIVRRRYPDMRVAGNEDFSLHDVVEDLAAALHLSNSYEERETSDDTVHVTARGFDDLFSFLRVLNDVPWLKGAEE